MLMRTIVVMFFFCLSLAPPLSAQNESGTSQPREQKFSAVNPVFFNYREDDVFILPPEKFEYGNHIIPPDPVTYPWEARLENGMPNVVKTPDGHFTIYISSFVSFASKPPSKVGVMAYTSKSWDIRKWTRPDAGLYWYNAQGQTADEKISPVQQPGFQPTNIVAVDVESVGIFEDTDPGVEKPIKLIYLPQRESHNSVLAGYEMERTFTSDGIFADFAKMKEDRLTAQKTFTFPFINGDTHMNYLKQNGDYYFCSRLNAKRSSLQPGEKLPLRPDNRSRYRRETITKLGQTLASQSVTLDIALDMSTPQWEPYSMQPFRMPGFEDDIWYGLVTMYGTQTDEKVAHRQRTELAFSNDGVRWRYLKPGIPFLDNDDNPEGDDYGCINIAKPVMAGTYMPSMSSALVYFYAASNQRHVAGRNPGISVAFGKPGKWAGLQAGADVKNFHSINPDDTELVTPPAMPKISLYDAMLLGSKNYPFVLADITQDPRDTPFSELNSYVLLEMMAYDPSEPHGEGLLLAGCLGSSKQGSTGISDEYESVGLVDGLDMHSKNLIFRYMKHNSDMHPETVVSLKHLTEVPIVLKAELKNATFYGFKFDVAGNDKIMDTSISNTFRGNNHWGYKPSDPSHPCHTESFMNIESIPNQFIPVNEEKGSIAVSLEPASNLPTAEQVILRLYGDEANCLGVYYLPNGAFQYRVTKGGLEYASMTIAPPAGQSFGGHQVILTVEALKNAERKYGKNLGEDATVLRVSCPDLSFEQVVQQPILWNWKHAEGAITDADRANARAFAYVNFSAFIPGMDKITIGGKDASCTDAFAGEIYNVEISKTLPPGTNDFWE